MAIAPWFSSELIRRLEALELAVRWVRAGSRTGGRFPINRRGTSIEFADYSPYTAGDDIRAIDWNLYARLDRLYVRTYKEEIALSVELIVDATPSMGLPVLDKFTRAQRLAVCLGYIALADRHHVRLSWIKPGVLTGGGWWTQRNDLPRMLHAVERGKTGRQILLAEWMRRAAITLKIRGGQAIVITDGMSRPADFFRAMHLLLVRHVEIKVIQVLTPQELRPARPFQTGSVVDAETGLETQLAYGADELARAVAEHNETLARFCKKHGIAFVQHRTDEPMESFLTKVLPRRGVLI
jgi:uncharacterized protein (DUF58 family)